jgi:hypothetical protein
MELKSQVGIFKNTHQELIRNFLSHQGITKRIKNLSIGTQETF